MAKIQLTSETRSLDRRKPGYALLKITGWKHSPEQTQMSIQSSEDEKFLGMDGQWEPTPVWQSLSNMIQIEDNILEGDVGPTLVDPIVNAPNNSYRVTLKSDSESEVKTMRIDNNILASSASGSAPDSLAFGNGFILGDVDVDSHVTETTEESEKLDLSDSDIDIEPEKPVNHVTETDDSSKKSSFFADNKLMIIILLVLLLLALLAAAAWYFKWLSSESSGLVTPEPVVVEPLKPVPPESTPESVKRPPVPPITHRPAPVASKLTDMELLRQFLATKPSTDDILARAEEWKNGHCKAMLKMMVYSGHKNNDSRITFEYAKMYDPNLFKAGGCIEKADKDTAIYWYQKSIDAGNNDAKSYLEKL